MSEEEELYERRVELFSKVFSKIKFRILCVIYAIYVYFVVAFAGYFKLIWKID